MKLTEEDEWRSAMEHKLILPCPTPLSLLGISTRNIIHYFVIIPSKTTLYFSLDWTERNVSGWITLSDLLIWSLL